MTGFRYSWSKMEVAAHDKRMDVETDVLSVASASLGSTRLSRNVYRLGIYTDAFQSVVGPDSLYVMLKGS